MCERERETGCVSVCVRERESDCVRVCVTERERKWLCMVHASARSVG